MAPRIERHREAEFGVGKKRPTLNLFSHGKKRKIAAELRRRRRRDDDDDDDSLRLALAASAGLLGAAGLYWAYTNQDTVRKAVSRFGVSSGSIAESGEVPEKPRSEDKPVGLARQDRRIRELAKGDPALERYVDHALSGVPALGPEIDISGLGELSADSDASGAHREVFEYIARRDIILNARMAAIGERISEGNDFSDPGEVEAYLRSSLGLSDDFSMENPGDDDLRRISDAYGGLITRTDKLTNSRLKSPMGQYEQRTQADTLQTVADALDSSPFAALPGSPATQNPQGFRDRAIQAIGASPGHPLNELWESVEDRLPRGDELSSGWQDFAESAPEDRVPQLHSLDAEVAQSTPGTPEHADAVAMRDMAFYTHVALLTSDASPEQVLSRAQRFVVLQNSADEDTYNTVAADLDATSLQHSLQTLRDSEAYAEMPGVREFIRDIESRGVDISSRDSIRGWLTDAEPESVAEAFANASSTTALALTSQMDNEAAAEQVMATIRETTREYTQRVEVTPRALGSAGFWADVPATALSRMPGAHAAAYTVIPAMLWSQHRDEATNTPDQAGSTADAAHLVSLQHRRYRSVENRIAEENRLRRAGDHEGLAELRRQPIEGFGDLAAHHSERQSRIARGEPVRTMGEALSTHVTAGVASTRSLGMMSGLGTMFMVAASPEMRDSFSRDPLGTSVEVASQQAGFLTSMYGFRHSARGSWLPTSGTTFMPPLHTSPAQRGLLNPAAQSRVDQAARNAGNAARRTVGRAAASPAAWATRVFQGIKEGSLQAGRALATNWRTGSRGARGVAGMINSVRHLRNLGTAAVGRAGSLGAARFAQYNTIMAGFEGAATTAKGAWNATFGDNDRNVQRVWQQAYEGTLTMGGDVVNRGGFGRSALRGALGVLTSGSTRQLYNSTAATQGANLMLTGRSGQPLRDFLSGELDDAAVAQDPAYLGYIAAMRDLQLSAVLHEASPHIEQALRSPVFAGISETQRAMIRDNLEGSFAHQVIPEADQQTHMTAHNIELAVNDAQRRINRFTPSADLLADPSGVEFYNETERFIRETVLGGSDTELSDQIMKVALVGMTRELGIDDIRELDANDFNAAITAHARHNSVRDFGGLPGMDRIALIHEAAYANTTRRVNALMQSSPNLRYLSPERKQAIRDAAHGEISTRMSAQIEEWRDLGASDDDIINGSEVTGPDGEPMNVSAMGWLGRHLSDRGYADLPTRPFTPTGDAGEVEADIQAKLTALVGEENVGVLDGLMDEVDALTNTTFEQRSHRPQQGLWVGERSEGLVEDVEEWRDAMKDAGLNIFTPADDPRFAASHAYDTPGVHSAAEEAYYEMTRELADAGVIPVRMAYDETDLAADRRRRIRDIDDAAQYFDLELDPQGNPTLVASHHDRSQPNFVGEEGLNRFIAQTQQLARVDPAGFAQRFHVPVDRVIMGLDAPNLRERSRADDGYTVYGDDGQPEVVQEWSEARRRMMGSVRDPQDFHRYAQRLSPQAQQTRQRLLDWDAQNDAPVTPNPLLPPQATEVQSRYRNPNPLLPPNPVRRRPTSAWVGGSQTPGEISGGSPGPDVTQNMTTPPLPGSGG